MKQIRAFKSIGMNDFSFEDYIEFSNHGIDADYIAELSALGFNDISRRQIIRLYNQNVTIDFIKEQKENGANSNWTIEDYIDLKVNGKTSRKRGRQE